MLLKKHNFSVACILLSQNVVLVRHFDRKEVPCNPVKAWRPDRGLLRGAIVHLIPAHGCWVYRDTESAF